MKNKWFLIVHENQMVKFYKNNKLELDAWENNERNEKRDKYEKKKLKDQQKKRTMNIKKRII
jgi:hypothetical protein